MIRKLPKIFFSYSFSFSKKLSTNLRYYKRTTLNHNVNAKIEAFVLSFMIHATPINEDTIISTPKRGRPKQKIKDDKLYAPCNFSFKKTTIEKIQEYKKKDKMPNLDAEVEKHLNVQIPVRK